MDMGANGPIGLPLSNLRSIIALSCRVYMFQFVLQCLLAFLAPTESLKC